MFKVKSSQVVNLCIAYWFYGIISKVLIVLNLLLLNDEIFIGVIYIICSLNNITVKNDSLKKVCDFRNN